MERMTPSRRREQTRLALLDAGASTFAARGYHGASLDDVAEVAGFTKGAIYDHFGSKEDFFFAVVEHRAGIRLQRFAEALDRPDATVQGMIDRTTTLLVELLQPDRSSTLLDAEAWLLAQRDEDARQRLAAQQRRMVERVTALILQAVEATGATLHLAPDDHAKLLIAATAGISRFALTDPDAGAERLFPQLLEILTETVIELPEGS